MFAFLLHAFNALIQQSSICFNAFLIAEHGASDRLEHIAGPQNKLLTSLLNVSLIVKK